MNERQQNLFQPDPPAWELDDLGEHLVASVVFARGPRRVFDYRVPDAIRAELSLGLRVRAPFGKSDRIVSGYCVGLRSQTADSRMLKVLDGLLEGRPLVSPAILRLTQWMAEYYLCPWGQVLETVLPLGVRVPTKRRETILVSKAARVPAAQDRPKLTSMQARAMAVLEELAAPAPIADVAKAAVCSTATIKTLVKRGLAQIQRQAASRSSAPSAPDKELKLNDDQRRALSVILSTLESGKHQTILIHGVTGSGKTEVYMQAIAEVVRYGRQAIVLVPEISLTPQTQSRFRARFGDVAVLHSHLSDVERRQQWERIAAGEVSVVVGARSAVFAPTPHLGLLVLDEEHETSFKQQTAPRYHARDVALERAKDQQVPLVLGSATPSLESWQRAAEGKYQLVSLPRRVYNRPLPAVGTIDMRMEARDRRSRGAISRPLHQAMSAALADGGQIILLLNRRGYSTHIQCLSCGWVCQCPNCAIALTHHWQGQLAVCHYCNYEMQAPGECPQCHYAGVYYRGLGTQRLEAEVRARFPDVTALRMDTDTMQKPGSHERALARFHEGEVRILLGTQMIAKGLDFPNVTLVGVVNADTALHLCDFRAAERTFQLVTQVAGRTGRGEKGGRVLVQTFNPEHIAIATAVRHDYQAFAAAELPLRKSFDYPPFSHMVRLVVRGPSEVHGGQFAEELARRLRSELGKARFRWRVLGPAAALLARLRGNYRFQIQLQGHDAAGLRSAVELATLDLKAPAGIQWIADVDPIDML